MQYSHRILIHRSVILKKNLDDFGCKSWKLYILQKGIAGQSKFFRQFSNTCTQVCMNNRKYLIQRFAL